MEVLSWNYPKVGNSLSETEDSFFFDEYKMRFAICDGASDSIFSGQWASVLARNFVTNGPDLRSKQELGTFLDNSRKTWLEEVPWSTLRWNVKNKAVRGAYSTFLAVELVDKSTARCFAVGDCCLFLKGDDKFDSFPLESPAQFGLHPKLIWSGYGDPLQNKEYEAKVDVLSTEIDISEVSDIIMATDAMAKFIMENGTPLFSELREKFNSQAYFDELRSNGKMKNDDVSGVFISF